MKCANEICFNELTASEEVKAKGRSRFFFCHSCRCSTQPVVLKCNFCMELFTRDSPTVILYCSRKCSERHSYNKLYKKHNFCEWCGKKVRGKYCSTDCHKQIKKLSSAERRLKEILAEQKKAKESSVEKSVQHRRLRQKKYYAKNREKLRAKARVNWHKRKCLKK